MSGILNDKNKNLIINRFNELEKLEDFVTLLNYIERNYIFPNETLIPIDKSSLKRLSINSDSNYSEFKILKKNGGIRIINSPEKSLMRVLRIINFLFQIIFEPYSHQNSYGFLNGKDIRKNAIPHINKNYILNMDIQNFFPSIQFRRIKVVLELNPFNLNNNREQIGFIIANLCTLSGVLPQGSPTSPILSNIVTQKLDRKITSFCKRNKIKYTRYADDLTFSSNKKIFNQTLIDQLSQIVRSENFIINDKKTRVKSSMDRQQVTGLIVNRKLNIKREYLQKTRAMINNWEKGGLVYAENQFLKHEPQKSNYKFKHVLLGHIAFIKLIKGSTKTVDNLLLKYSFLNNQIDYNHIQHTSVKNRLKKDNIKMEKLLFEDNIDSDDIFISFCTSAFHQIENLINYFYWKKFPVFDNLLDTLILENPKFKKRYNSLEKAKYSFKQIKDLNINVLVYLYEKEFYFDKKKYYKQQITKLREVRNDESHRCEVIDLDKEKIIKDYTDLTENIEKQKKRGKNYGLSNDEQKLIQSYELLEFLKQKNFKEVRKTVYEVNESIKNYFNKSN